jgi:redox-sensitive bicupin YhaK (pirin superfamily)
MNPSSPMNVRDLVQVTRGTIASDGDGVRLTRLIGGSDVPMVDPFLLLDCFGSDQPTDYIGGFPDHPHRGFETVTYMLAGRMRHKDSTGTEDVIGPGDVQWMTAGRGLIHSEMPEQAEGLMKGFQLWVNLPAADKMTAPTYRAVSGSEIPVEGIENGGFIKVIAGITDGGTVGSIAIATVAPLFFDVALDEGTVFTQAVPAGHQGFLYVIEGQLTVGPRATVLTEESLGVLGPGDQVVVTAGTASTRFLLVSGRALGEPIARYGPFVMNTREEIIQAIQDFQSGQF